MSKILSRKQRRARKEHACDLCGERIVAGEGYIYFATEESGRVRSYKQHITCDALAERYCMAMDKNEYDEADVEDWVWDEVCKECGRQEECGRQTALTCPAVLRGLLPAALLTNEDVRRHL